MTTIIRRTVSTAALSVVVQPAGLVVVAVFYLMVTSVLSGVWHAAAVANGGAVVGYSATALVWYVATSEAATIALPQRLIEIIGSDIGSGQYTGELLRPASPLLVRVASQLGQMLPRLAACVIVGITFTTLVGGAPPSFAALGLALPSLVLALAINLVAQHAVAGAAFWVLDSRGTWFLYQKLVFVLGGMLLPLEVLPSWLESIARVLPFSAMAYAPARLASGHFEPELLAIQAFWFLATAVAASMVFAAGERRMIGVGA